MLNRLLAAALLVALGSNGALAQGDAAAGEAKAKEVCAACHGEDGNSIAPTFPNLAQQVPGYIADQLAKFKSGEREGPQMAPFAANLTEEDMHNLDAYFVRQVARPGAIPESDVESATRGQKLYRGGFADMEIAPCMSCHGPSGHGVPVHYPRVAGQQREYLKQQLLQFKDGKREGYREIMSSIAFRLSLQQIEDVSAYMHSLR